MRMIAISSRISAIFLTLMCAGILLAAASANASLQVTTGNPGLTHFDSDGGVELDFGLTDQAGQPVGNLTKDNVQVLEDGKPARILYFRGVGQGRPVDIIFVLDITESMQPYIDAVKQNIINFAHDLAANNRDYRLGLVTFEDYVVSKYPDCNCEYRNTMTSDVQKFITWVGSLHAGGGGDIPEDQLDALAYAASFPFRPEAQGIIIIVTDAPPHHDGDGSAFTQHDQAFWNHHQQGVQVTDLTGSKVADLLKKNGLTLYAVAPPPFIAPEYKQIVDATHGKLYNIVTEEDRFAELVREIGHSIATEYSLTYLTPRPVEDGTNRSVELRVNYSGESGTAETSYQVRGIGGAAINEPVEGGTNAEGEGIAGPQISFSWWNAGVPLMALLGLLALSRMRFGVSAEELKAIVEAQAAAPTPSLVADARHLAQRARGAGQAQTVAKAGFQATPSGVQTQAATIPAGSPREARLTALDRIDQIPAEFALLKDEISLGRGEDNDIVIPHPSVSRAHARLVRRDGVWELTDLNSTNGSYVNEQPVHGSARAINGSEVRFGDIRFVLRL
jgi:hypothetical protein